MKEIMKDKNLLTEITRIKEMMGISLITESIPPKTIRELLQILLPKTTTKFTKDLITSALNKVAKNKFNTADLKTLFDELKLKGSPAIKTAITKFENKIVNKASGEKYTKEIQQRLNDGTSELDIERNILADWKSTYGDYIKGTDIEQRFVNKLKNRITKVKEDLAAQRTDTSTTTNTTRTDTTTPRTEETDLSSEIPDSELVTTEIGPVPKIFKVETWNSEDFVNLSDESIELLINQPFWEKAILYFQKLFTVTNGQLRNIQKLGKALETTTDASVMVKLERILKTELKSLYRKNTNNFVEMIKYFDLIARQPGNRNWARIWSDIKGQSNGGWDFYKTFGSIKDVTLWTKFWEGITDNLKVLYETEAKYGAKLTNKVFKTNYKPEMIGNFLSAFKSGSRRGFPSLNNKQYEKLIKEFGPGAARVSYFRDLVVTTLKWSVYIGTLKTLRNAISYLVYQDDITPCAKSGDRDSKECNDLINDVTQDKWLNWFRTNFINWAIQYQSGAKVGDTDIVKSWGQEILNNLSPDIISDTIEGDKWYKTVGDIVSLDMGWVGDVFVGMPTEFFNIIDNPLRRESLINAIDKNIETAKENLEKSKLEVENEVKKVVDDEVVNDIDEDDFRRWCQTNGKVFVRYDEGIGTTFEEGKEKYWYFDTDTNTFEENKPE
jgi:hypothetical protein